MSQIRPRTESADSAIPISIQLEAPPDVNGALFLGSAITTDTPRTATGVTVSQDLIREVRHDPFMSKTETRRIQLKDMTSMMRQSMHFSEVTTEQIDRVRVMHDRISQGAGFNFNYNTLLLVASVLAGLGLASGSSTTVIASMLVSPIMGPVVAVAYGLTINDYKLVRTGLKTECLSLLFCILIGVIIGACCGWTEMAEGWPNSEQSTRASWTNFMVGLPVAFFSGLGVAVSLLDEQTNSLVGVAISASLLPPAVNPGTIWVAYLFFKNGLLGRANGIGEVDGDDALDPYENLDRHDFRKSGMISLFLTIANIVLIIIASMLMFRMKERLPIKKKVFWEDLRVARKIYQNRAFLADVEAISEDDGPVMLPEACKLPPGPVVEGNEGTHEETGADGEA